MPGRAPCDPCSANLPRVRPNGSMTQDRDQETTIRIAQVSDLLAGPSGKPSETAAEPSLRRFLTQAIEEQFQGLKLDYLVVCGNLTAGGRPESFKAAGRVLEGLLSAGLLKEDGARPLKSRLFFVPGPRDVAAGGGLDLGPFGAFHDAFFADEIKAGEIEGFHPRGAILRHLKDLTFVGFTYWPGEASDREERFGLAEENLAAVGGPFEYAYIRRTPTFLVSAGMPHLEPGARAWLERSGPVTVARELGTTLHLFGAGEQDLVAPQPFGFAHAAIGTGPKSEGPPWPLSVNFIELAQKETALHRQPRLEVAHYRQFQEDRRPEHRRYEAPQLAALAPPQWEKRPAPDLSAYLLDRLARRFDWDNAQLLWVSGLPGSGRWAAFDGLEEECSVNGRTLPIFRQKLLPWGRRRVGDAIKDLIEEIRRRQVPRGQKILVVIRDFLFKGLLNQEKDEHIADVDRRLALLNDYLATIVYIVDTVDYDPSFSSLPPPEKEVLGPLDPDTMSKLESHYGERFPLGRDQVGYLTGGYATLSQQICETAEHLFSDWPGATSIRSETSRKLLAGSLSTRGARRRGNPFLKTVDEFLATLRLPAVGAQVEEYLRGQVTRTLDCQRMVVEGFPREVISFRAEDCIRAVGEEPEEVGEFLDVLADYRVLARHSEDGPYDVRVPAPFLPPPRPRLQFARRGPGWPPASRRYQVFFSLREEDLDDVKLLIGELDREITDWGDRFEPFLYTEPQDHPGTIDQIHEDNLRNCRNLVLLHEGGPEFLSPWLPIEAKTWLDSWGGQKLQRQASLVPLVKRPGQKLPLVLNNDQAIHFDRDRIGEIVAAILARLVGDPDDEEETVEEGVGA